MCWEGDNRLLYALGAAAVLAIALGVPALLIVKARGDRALVAGTWLAALLLGAGSVAVGFANDENFAVWALAGAVAGLLVGAGAAAYRHRRPVLSTAVGVMGGGGPIIGLFAALVGSLAITGNCLD